MILSMETESETYTAERCHIIEILGRSADAECSIARARVEPGVTTQLHALRGITERYVILKGEGTMEVGGVTGTVRACDVVLIPQSVSQRITNAGPNDLVFLSVCTPAFRTDAYENLDSPSHPGYRSIPLS